MKLSVTREIADGARIAPDARIGHFCVIGPHVVIGARTVLGRRVTVCGNTRVGADNVIDDGCVLGTVPQDLKFRGRDTVLLIGDRNRLGPNVTAHIGTEAGGFCTRIGSDNVLAAGAHVAHDCYVDDATRLGPGVLLAGHVRVEDGAVIEDGTGCHHFTTIGRYSRVGARTPVRRDVPPFTHFSSLGYYTRPPAVLGVHEDGLARAGLSERDQADLRRTIEHLFADEQALAVKVDELLARADLSAASRALCAFCRRTASGKFGRHREVFRGRVPPEAAECLPAEALAKIGRGQGANQP